MNDLFGIRIPGFWAVDTGFGPPKEAGSGENVHITGFVAVGGDAGVSRNRFVKVEDIFDGECAIDGLGDVVDG